MALDFFAGCLGGCAGVIVGHPLDTVKVNLQTQDPKNPKFRGTIHCLRSIVAKEGFKGLYRGVSSPLGGVAAINAIVFGVYGNTQRGLPDPDAIYSHFLAGTAAGIAQSFICSPIELAKTRAQISSEALSPWDIIKKIRATEGFRGVYRGLNITIAREIPGFSTYFVSYELMTRSVSDGGPISTATMFIAGGLAGSFSWVFAYPIDIIKTRMQVDGMDGNPPRYKNSLDCVRKGIAEEGRGFLWRGFTPAVVRAFPVNAACFTVVTWTMRLCQGDYHIHISREQEMQIM